MSVDPSPFPLPLPRKTPYTGRQWIGIGLTAVIVFSIFAPLVSPLFGSLMSWKTTILIGFALVGLAGWLARREHAWLQKAQVVPGTVIELIRVRGSKGGSSYKPRVQYTTTDGSVRDFVRSYSSTPAGVDVGEQVAVAYDPAADDARILTFGQRYGFAAFIAMLGVSLILLAATFLVGRQYVPRIYLHGGPASQTSRGW